MKKWIMLMVALTFMMIQLTTVYTKTKTSNISQQMDKGEYNLHFDVDKFTTKTLSINGLTIKYRAYENIVYVKYPIDIKYECMNFYVPQEYYEGKSIDNYNIETAPIFFPNSIGGYMPSEPGRPDKGRGGGANAAFIALSKGYVVAMPGARGRTIQNKNGQYTGKAPACIVDLKAAVRYLRYNDKAMPGNAEKIISNGTSAGGALSSLVGATGNNKDYEPYLKALGAADERDDIFAVSAYCPITNLDNADMAYEWLFNGIEDYKKVEFLEMQDGKKSIKEKKAILTAEQIKTSAKLKAMFPAYVNFLELKKEDGTLLTLDKNGNGTFKEYVKSFVITSAQKALDNGKNLSTLAWITIKNNKVTDINFEKYIEYATRMKTPPAFDGLDLGTPENNLFGTTTINAQHFTKFGNKNSTASGSLADATIVKMMNPMNYISTKGTTTAKYWRIRHGSKDRDTALVIPIILTTKLKNNGFNVDFALPWDQPHSGDYDLDDLFAWMDKVCS